MNKFLIVIVVCVLLYACKPGIPKNIIQPDQMEKVLYDIHLVDGYSAGLNFPAPDSAKKVISPFYKGVYKKFGIDSALFAQSLNYYYKHPELLVVMYDHITEKLTKAKDKAVKSTPVAVDPVPAPKALDSVQKIHPITKPTVNKLTEAKPVEAKPIEVKPVKAKRTKRKSSAPKKVS
jgi:hypothetical protein